MLTVHLVLSLKESSTVRLLVCAEFNGFFPVDTAWHRVLKGHSSGLFKLPAKLLEISA